MSSRLFCSHFGLETFIEENLCFKVKVSSFKVLASQEELKVDIVFFFLSFVYKVGKTSRSLAPYADVS